MQIELFQLAIQMFDQGFISSPGISSCQRDACPITRIYTSSKIINLCEESMHVFNGAIMFTTGKVNCSDTRHHDANATDDGGFTLCYMILLFNLALAHQQKGKISGRASDFQNASTIYLRRTPLTNSCVRSSHRVVRN
jgi:hypothetical protein